MVTEPSASDQIASADEIPSQPDAVMEGANESPRPAPEDSPDDAVDDDEASLEELPLTMPSATRPSESDTLISPETTLAAAPSSGEEPYIVVARRSHIGAIRKRNEDSCYSFVAQAGGDEPLPLFGLFVVADGMGGHFDGHMASKIVSRMVAQHLMENIYGPLLQDAKGAAVPPIQEVMEEAVFRANQALYLPDPEKEMGTTLTAALILGSRLFLVHVGDSRAYLLQEKRLRPVTTDHSVVQALQDAGQLTPEEAAIHPNRNLLYRALVGEALEQVDTFTQVLPDRGMLLLCSDGLWGLVPEASIEEVLNQDIQLKAKVDQLVEKALAAGGHDNITAVLVDFSL